MVYYSSADDASTIVSLFHHQKSQLPTTGRTIYLSRHGESLYNLDQRIGGNPSLSDRGHQYAKQLADKMNMLALADLQVWTSELVRTHETVAHIRLQGRQRRQLAEFNELDSGLYDNLTYEQFERLHPVDFASRERNKLTYRYPNGESYVDLCKRLEPVLPEMDLTHNLLVVSHQAVLRCIMAYLQRFAHDGEGLDVETTPYIRVPLHTLIKVTFNGTHNEFEFIPLGIDCVDTHRPQAEPQTVAGETTTQSGGLLASASQQQSGTITCAN